MNLPLAVVVEGWADVRMVLVPGLPVTLLSAPGAACHAGIGWWRALVRLAERGARGRLADVLDCGDSAGLAVEALREGCRTLVLSPALPAWTDVAGRAKLLGATLLEMPPRALRASELRAARGGAATLEAWLRDSSASVG